MTRPRVSVVLPVFNGERHLEAAIRSVREQTLADLELIVIDDGSTDRSRDIACAQAARDRRIRVISRENRGLVTSLNEGIRLADAEWVARMDADDCCTPRRLDTQLAWASAHGLDLCGGAIRTMGLAVRRLRSFPLSPRAVCVQLAFNTAFAHPAVVCRRNLALRMPYDPGFETAEDYELWTRMAVAGAAMGNCPQVVLHYRVHAMQISRRNAARQAGLRARVSERYRSQAFPEWDRAGGDVVLMRRTRLSDELFDSAMTFLRECAASTGDPEGVVSSNAFAFLMRHGELGLARMLDAARSLGLSPGRVLAAAAMAAAGGTETGRLYRLLRRAH